jgi:hypothetical protein
MLLEIDFSCVQSCAADLVGALDDFMSCLQPLCFLCCFGECARFQSDTLPPPSATNLTYQTHDSGSSLKHHYQRLHMILSVGCGCLSRCSNETLNCFMAVL